MVYRLALDLEALRFLLSLKAKDREEILSFLELLRTKPFSKGDLTVRDATDRDIEAALCRQFLIYYWSDHAIRTIQVAAIELNLP